MPALLEKSPALAAPTQFIEAGGRRLAYRKIGSGPPLVLCLRFRGILDSWDPAFLDSLARHFTVITFDYSGIGRSTGASRYKREALAEDAKTLVDALGLEKFVLGGWSLGGIAAQVFTARYPERVTHLVLIGTTPPGEQPHPPEPIFLPTALKFDNTLEDEYILFFEPDSASSRRAGKASHDRIAQRTADTSPPIPEATYHRLLSETADQGLFPDTGGYAVALSQTSIPILVISGDHDIVFPVENWHALNRRWKSLHLMTFPQSGHGPNHEFPAVCADLITSFVGNIEGGQLP
jgi:pimeloyl-ACP methyl ester carboxylesterase